MQRAALEHIEVMISEEVAKRFPGAAIQRVVLLQYGDDPAVEPGELMIRVILESPGGEVEREQTVTAFHEAHRAAIQQFREDIDSKLPEARRLEFLTSGDDSHGPGIRLHRPGRLLEARALAGGDLTPVMARLGPADLETLDTLITAGIAPNRAEAVRWALARIRERPAYGKLRDRSREIEELKAQF
jgi:hypothetical protein